MAIDKFDENRLIALKFIFDEYPDDLDYWQYDFVESILERYKQYGQRVLVSSKQWEQIDKILEEFENV